MGDTSTDAQKEQVQSKCEQMQILRRMIFFFGRSRIEYEAINFRGARPIFYVFILFID